MGAALLEHHYDEGKKSQAEKSDPEGVEWLCGLIGDLLDDWEPRTTTQRTSTLRPSTAI